MDNLTATVTSLRSGRFGPFAIASSDMVDGSVTFSLRQPVWDETRDPEPGDTVYLSTLRRTKAGWRALRGRFLKPADE